MKEIHLLVLAGGFGTRLRPAVADVPKPLAPVAAKPYLEYLIDSWLEQGVSSMSFLLHHQSALIEEFLYSLGKRGAWDNCRLHIVKEEQPMGTGGAIAFASRQLGLTQSFLVANADTWLGTGIAQIANVEAPAIAVVQVENAERYGSVDLQVDKIVAFKEKQHSNGAGWINAGLYHLHPALFDSWKGQPFSMEQVLFPALVKAGALNALALNTDFIDIGIPSDYFRFCRWIDSRKTETL